MDTIRAWYNGNRDYNIGVLLFLQYGKDERLKALFRKGKTDFSEQKLAEELKSICMGDREKEPAPEYDLPPNLFSTDPVVEELYRRKSALHKEKDILRHSLETIPTDEERGRVAHKVLSLREQIDAIWEIERYYKERGRLPEGDPGITDPAMLQHRRHQVNTNIRRLRAQLKRDPHNERYKKSFDKYDAEYKELQRKIAKYKKTHE